jgi:tyrosine-protein kinase Etk/Wzc
LSYETHPEPTPQGGKPLQDLDLRKVIVTVQRGRWAIVAILLFTVIPAYLYTRYTPSLFESAAYLKIDVGADKALSGIGGNSNDNFLAGEIENQAELVRSRATIQKTIEKLNLNVQYFKRGRVIKAAQYANFCPFEVIPDSTNFHAWGESFELQFLGGDKFVIFPILQPDLRQTCKIGQICIIDNSVVRIKLRQGFKINQLIGNYLFKIRTTQDMVSEITAKLKVELYRGTIYKLVYVDEVAQRAKDIPNTVAEIYLNDELTVLKRSSDQTIMFIDTLLMAVNEDMKGFERNLETYENVNQVPINELKRDYRRQGYLESETSVRTIDLSILALNKLKTYVLAVPDVNYHGEDPALLPQLPDVLTPEINEMNAELNKMQLKRYAFVTRYGAESPIIKNVSEEVKAMKQVLFSSLDENIETLKDKKRMLYQQQGQLTGQISAYLSLERGLENARKPYSLYEKIYNDLFNKKTEASITRAAITSRSRIVNSAIVPRDPISPKRDLILYGSIVFGLLLGFAFVLIRESLKDTMELRFDAENRTTLPFIAEIFRIPRASTPQTEILRLEVFKNTKSILTESFRSLRSNVTFLIDGMDKQQISITSTISGEGKSFIALNLAAILSTLNKKVVLVDLDLRRPRLHQSLNMSNEKGASSVLVKLEDLDGVIQNTGYANFDIITSGPIPPNPAELLSGQSFNDFMEELKRRYDYIIYDTSPVGLVTDAINIMKICDLNLYIFRAEYSKLNFFKMAERLRDNQQLNNLYLVFNFSNPNLSKYGYKYGYGYGYAYGYSTGYYTYTEDDAPRAKWWQFWKQ